MSNLSQSKKSKLLCHANHFAAAVISMRHAQALSSSLKTPATRRKTKWLPGLRSKETGTHAVDRATHLIFGACRVIAIDTRESASSSSAAFLRRYVIKTLYAG